MKPRLGALRSGALLFRRGFRECTRGQAQGQFHMFGAMGEKVKEDSVQAEG